MNYKNHEFNWIEEYLEGRAELEASTWAASEQSKREALRNAILKEKAQANNTPTPIPPERVIASAAQTKMLLEDYLDSLLSSNNKGGPEPVN